MNDTIFTESTLSDINAGTFVYTTISSSDDVTHIVYEYTITT